MPLMTEIRRNGEPMTIRWGWWHVDMMNEALKNEGYPEGIFDPNFPGAATLSSDWGVSDPSDGETLMLRAGDELAAWHSTFR